MTLLADPVFLFLHVLGAIVAFGPAFAFPLIGAMAAQGAAARELRRPRHPRRSRRGSSIPLALSRPSRRRS